MMDKIPLPETFTPEQEQALLNAHHEALRSHARDMILEGVAQMKQKALPFHDYVMAVFDIDDPFTPDPVVAHMRKTRTGYAAQVVRRENMVDALRAFQLPAEEVDVRWSKSSRTWVTPDGKIAKDFPLYPAFAAEADHLLKPAGEGQESPEDFFYLVTFTRGSVAISLARVSVMTQAQAEARAQKAQAEAQAAATA